MSACPPSCSASAAAAAAAGAIPNTSPPASRHADASVLIAVVLPAPAGAIANCTRSPEDAILRTRSTWPEFSSTPLASAPSSARLIDRSPTTMPSRRPASASSRVSASRICCEV